MTNDKKRSNRTLLVQVTVYLTPALAEAIDRGRGEKSRGVYIRDRLARSLKTEKPVVRIGRRKHKPPDTR